MRYSDTIAAISTPYGVGGVAVIRLSGVDAIEIASRCFESKTHLTEVAANSAVYGKIYLDDADGRRCVDDGIATVFRAPRSFTGENTVEIGCHGGILVTKTVLLATLAAGARQAERGEFTRRAFVNGKLGLTAAEALGSLLYASTQSQLELARGGMSGALSRATDAIYEKLLTVSTAIRARIDFPEEDLSELTEEEILSSLESAQADLTELAGTYSTGRAITEGITTVICGRTNAGKSSLYNRIAGYEAAIVTDIAGTTRDLLVENVSFGGVTLRLTDTAGLRETDDTVEKIGVERAGAAIENAGLIFAVFDGSSEFTADDERLVAEVKKSRAKVFAIINKSDIHENVACVSRVSKEFPDVIKISAKTGEGTEKLAALVNAAYIDGSLDLSRDAVVSNERQHGAILRAKSDLDSAITAMSGGVPVDAVCSDVERSMASLAETDGREVGEDIVSGIFSKFCVGK